MTAKPRFVTVDCYSKLNEIAVTVEEQTCVEKEYLTITIVFSVDSHKDGDIYIDSYKEIGLFMDSEQYDISWIQTLNDDTRKFIYLVLHNNLSTLRELKKLQNDPQTKEH